VDFEAVPSSNPILTTVDLDRFLKGILTHDKPIGIDTEGTGLNILDGRDFGYGVSIAYRDPDLGMLAHYMPFRHPYGENLDPQRLIQLQEILHQRRDEGRAITSHNLTYDLDSLLSLGINYYPGRAYCTLIGCQLVDENNPAFNKNLDNCGLHYLGYGKLKGPEGAWYYQTALALYTYARHDAIMHYELGEKVIPLMDKERLFDSVWPQKLRTVHLLNKMRRRGVLIDQSLCERELGIGLDVMEDLAQTLGFNPGSPKQLGEFLVETLGLPILKRNKLTAKQALKGMTEGNPCFDSETMEEYDEILERINNPSAQMVKEYRGWSKATSSCYKAYLDLVSPDGRLRTNYNLHRVKTGRLSSNSPNLQQIPRESTKPWHGAVKSAFVARPGYVLLEGDYSQLEFRLGAAYARETRLIDVFNDDSRDVFSEMATQLGMARQDVKTLTYTLNYGGGINRIKNVFGVSEQRAYTMKHDFETNYPELKRTSNAAQRHADRHRKVQLWNGRYRHFKWKTEHHKAFNSIMQGGAADIVECAMHRLEDNWDKDGEREMLLQIHDSVVAEVREDLEEEASRDMKRIMEDVNVTLPDGSALDVKFKVDVHRFNKAA
jgi:DNA polymerase I-like protein with 3'-5' exonuclease and polymerase domains